MDDVIGREVDSGTRNETMPVCQCLWKDGPPLPGEAGSKDGPPC